MSKGVELTEKELKEVVGGACVENGWIYFYVDGQNYKTKILKEEQIFIDLINDAKKNGVSDASIADSLIKWRTGGYLGDLIKW